jgi:methionyl aminopeptidase
MTDYQTVTAETRHARDGAIKLHGPDGFAGMRKVGLLSAQILDALTSSSCPVLRPRKLTIWCCG